MEGKKTREEKRRDISKKKSRGEEKRRGESFFIGHWIEKDLQQMFQSLLFLLLKKENGKWDISDELSLKNPSRERT